MSEKQYRIVFRGELAYGFEMEEARANLKRLCQYNDSTLDKLFSSGSSVLKTKLSYETAKKYKAALDGTGAVCVIEDDVASAGNPVSGGRSETLECPKCFKKQPVGMTCIYCGIVFSKFQMAQERQAALERGEYPPASLSCASDAAPETVPYFVRHQEQAFILKAFLVIAAIIFVTEYLSGFITLLIILFPVLFLIGVRLHAAATGESPTQVLAQHITFMPVMYAEGERKREGVAWVTYGIILINILVFYGFELNVDPRLIFNNLIFIPMEPNAVNVPLSLFTSMFLHGSGMHLWGNMLFLWAIGTVVEKRIGWKRFLAFYIFAGIAADLMSALVDYLFFHSATHGLGASGAIAGAMGLFAVRCYFKSMVFPLPILGIFSLILPVSLKVRLNSLVIIGLFFLADLSGGIGQLTGQGSSNIGHWAHIGGMVCGIILGMMFNLGEEAVEERHQEIGSQALSKGGNLFEAEDSLRLALKKNPDNGDTMILLARLLSKFHPTEEAENLYRKGMDILSKTRMKEVAETFKEYYGRYLKGINPDTLYRLSSYYQQQKDFDWAVRCLGLLADDASTPPALRERAMFQCARQMEAGGEFDIAMHYYQQLTNLFPQSPLCEKAIAKLKAS